MTILKKTGVALALISALALSACNSATAEPEKTSSASATTDEQVAAATKAVAAAADTSGIDVPFPDIPAPAGEKRVAIISAGQNSILSAAYAKWTTEAAAAAGWKPSQTFDAALDTNKMGGFIQQAVSEKYDAIFFSSMDPHAFSAAIDAAHAAGIPVACMSCSNLDFEDKLIAVGNSLKQQGELIGAYMISNSKGKANILAFPDVAYPTVITRFKYLKDYVAANCPGCTYKETQFTQANLAKPGPPEFTAALANNAPGTLTDILAPYGTAAVLMAKSAEAAGRTELSISAVDTTADTILQTSEGKLPLGATPVSAQEFNAWTLVDLVIRKIAGIELYTSDATPVGLVTKKNAAAFLPQGIYQPNIDYKSKFAALWKK